MPSFNNPTLCILLLASFTIGLANAARLLDSIPTSLPVAPGQFFPTGQFPAVVVPTTDDTVNNVNNNNDDEQVVDDSERVSSGQLGPDGDDVTASVNVATPPPSVVTLASVAVTGTISDPDVEDITAPVNAVTAPQSTVAAGSGAATGTIAAPFNAATPSPSVVAAGSGAVTAAPGSPAMSFFMHDILGGSQPTTRAVTGIIASAQINGIPFSKSNNQIFPINGATPLPTSFINNYRTTLPFLAGLNGAQNSAILQKNGNNAVTGGGNQPFVTAGNLPAGATLQQLMFGSITVIDDELTEGHELGSGVIGRAQGFYLASSLDGTSHTFAFTALLGSYDDERQSGGGGGGVEDTISFFGVHRTASIVSHIVVVGGTGKYENAKGYATIEPMHQLDQHITDGVDTVFQFHVYL